MLKTIKFDILDYLKTEKDIRRYLDDAFEEGDPDFIPIALGDAARARKKIADISAATGMKRPNVYRAFRKGSRPSFDIVAKAARALGYRLSLVPC